MPEAKFILKVPNGDSPTLIYLFYNFEYTRLKYSTGQKIHPKFWNPEKQRAKESRGFPEFANFNYLLNALETTVNNAYRSLLLSKRTPTPDLLKKELDDFLETRSHSKDFLAFATGVLESSDRKASTKKAIKQTLTKLTEYQTKTRKPIQFDSIDLDFYNDFISYLTGRNLMQATIGSHIKNLKLFMREAFERGLTANVQFQSKRFKKPGEESESIYLTKDEIQKIQDLDLSENKRLEKVRDLFLIACNTGLRFSDLSQLQIESQSADKKVLRVRMQKTSDVVVVPINSTVNRIIEKYGNHLPTTISNNKMNKYLKEVGEMVGLDESIVKVTLKKGKRVRDVYKKYELLTVHTARRSFATNAFLQNVPSISIMKITGHKTEKTFLKYIKISQEENAHKLAEHPFFA